MGWLLGDVHGATANERATACASTKFCQGHPHGHIVTLSLPPPSLAPEPVTSRVVAAMGASAKQSLKCKRVNHENDRGMTQTLPYVRWIAVNVPG